MRDVESRSIQEISLTSTQQPSTEMIATAVTETTSSATHVAGAAIDAVSNTDEADKQSQFTNNLITQTVSNIKGLATELTTASKAVSALDNDAHNIAKVLDVIGGIAEQTQISDDIAKRVNMIEESSRQLNGGMSQSHNGTLILSELSNELEVWVNKFRVENSH